MKTSMSVKIRTFDWKRGAIASISSVMLLGGQLVPLQPAIAGMQISQRQQDWNSVLNLRRIQETNQVAMQLDLLDKPATEYAIAFYRLYARRNNRWIQIYETKEPRRITNAAGKFVLAPEVVSLNDLQDQLGRDLDWSNLELKAVALLRYAASGGRGERRVHLEQSQRYTEITQVTMTQLNNSVTTWMDGRGTSNSNRPGRNNSARRAKSRFSLAILQPRASLHHVIARISLKERQSDRFLQEQFIGDFRYNLKDKSKAKFIKGLQTGDRMVVRLFSPQNELIGYSEFELLSTNTAVTLVLPDSLNSGIVRTIYGIDANENFSLDQDATVYDYFTQIVQTRTLETSRVTFLRRIDSVYLREFDIVGLPAPRRDCSYPDSFEKGSFALVDRRIQVFDAKPMPILISSPGQLVQITNISTTTVSTYEVNQRLVQYREVNGRDVVVRSNEDEEDD
jgi:hypothetical protein